MFTAISLFFKTKVFTTSGVFLLSFLALIAVFIFSNSNVILSKFGFETTTTLKSELVSSQKDLEKVVDVNKDLVIAILETEKRHVKEKETVKSHNETKVLIAKKVTKAKSELKLKLEPLESLLVEKIVTTETTITIPIEEYNKLSEQNIDALHAAFTAFQLESYA